MCCLQKILLYNVVLLVLMKVCVKTEITEPYYGRGDDYEYGICKANRDVEIQNYRPLGSSVSSFKIYRINNQTIVDRKKPFLIKENDPDFVDMEIVMVIFTDGEVAFVPPEIYKNLAGVQAIELYNTQTRTLDNFIGNSKRVLKFKIEDSLIPFIGSNIFVTANKLEEIILGHNTIEEIHEDAFKSLTALKRLDLSNNRLTRVEPGWFKDLEKISIFIVDKNNLITIDDKTFLYAKSLVDIKLRNNTIQEISKNAFSGLSNLKQLDLSRNKCIDRDYYSSINPDKNTINNIRQTIFQYRSCKMPHSGCETEFTYDLEEKKQHYNTINDIKKLYNLKRLPLTLARCKVPTSFCKFPSLQNGTIKSLTGHSINGNDDIFHDETVQVICDKGYAPLIYKEEENEITCQNGAFNKRFPPCNFVCQDSTSGACRGNGIGKHTVQLHFQTARSYWEIFTWTPFKFEEDLVTYFCENFDVPHAFILQQKIHHKALYSRKHELVDFRIIAEYNYWITGEGIPNHLTENVRVLLKDMVVHYVPTKVLYNAFPNIRSLCLAETKTEVIDDQFFDESSHLVSFECRSQTNLSLKANAFTSIPNLEFINFYCNNIVDIDPRAFSQLFQLKRLYLEDNYLTYIEPLLFKDLYQLKELNLESNQITTINSNFFEYLNNIAVLDLNSNEIFSVNLPALRELRKLDKLNLSGNKCIDANFINATKTQDDINLLNCFLRTCKAVSNEAFKQANLQFEQKEIANYIEGKCRSL